MCIDVVPYVVALALLFLLLGYRLGVAATNRSVEKIIRKAKQEREQKPLDLSKELGKYLDVAE